MPHDTANIRILIVEDNPANRKLATAMLRQLGYKPDTAGNGREAVEAQKAHAYEIILMDCRMPLLDGLEATRMIRADEHRLGRRKCQIIAITGDALTSDRERCLEAGMDSFVTKPYMIEDLRGSIEQAITNAGA